MRESGRDRLLRSAGRLVVLAAAAAVPPCTLSAEPGFVRDGRAGFVVSYIEYALADDFSENGACPAGSPLNLVEIHQLTPQGQRRPGESDEDYLERMQQAARQLGTSADGQDLCMHPEVAAPDPHFKTVAGSAVPVWGIDLDGQSGAEDFPGKEGGEGVDNQWYRVVGCSRSYQSAGQSNGFNIAMLTGSWGILFALEGVDDIRNDDAVTVHLYANGDPIRLSPAREPLAFATYTAKPEPRYSATTTGKIVDGVLTSVPVDVVFQNETNSMYNERPLRAARLQVSIDDAGTARGYLAGYTPVEAVYDFAYAFRSGVKADGQLAPLPLRAGSANGAAFVLGHTCQGAYQALWANADAYPDPETGANTAISMQYRIEAIPAFVVAPQGVKP
ncbi:hypothetical protein [Haliea sp. E17]|uniref:hypothetical protein n=1 Tax=Haliea sp. E17 TaxID=3401576 RepID=UPI003AAF98E7